MFLDKIVKWETLIVNTSVLVSKPLLSNQQNHLYPLA